MKRHFGIGAGTASTYLQWLLLSAALLILGGVIDLDLYSEYKDIDSHERGQLATQARVIDENLARQLHSTNLVLDSIRSDLPGLRAERDSKARIIHRLQEPARLEDAFSVALKQDPDLSMIPVVVLTTSEVERDVLASYSLGAAGFITKPMDVLQFMAVVRELGDYWFALVRLPQKT